MFFLNADRIDVALDAVPQNLGIVRCAGDHLQTLEHREIGLSSILRVTLKMQRSLASSLLEDQSETFDDALNSDLELCAGGSGQ